MSALALEKFECEGDPTSLVGRWERWKRALQIYLLAASIDNSEKKKACLLHFGGQELQEIYFNIPDGSSSQEETTDVFKTAIEKLDSYFAPKQSKVYERHVFRLIKQEPNEKFDKFLVRLRQQGSKCHFSSLEDTIIDQIVEKGNSDELRRKILQKGDEMTLDKIIVEANALEAVNRQMEDFGNKNVSQGINKIDVKQGSKTEIHKKQECTRCGNRFHSASDRNCPAKTKECFKCGSIGHYRNMCRSSRKRKIEDDLKTNNKKKFKPTRRSGKVDQVSEEETNEIDYVFNVNYGAEIECKVGGVKVNMLIDSGCKENLITEETWNILKNNKAQIRNPDKNPKKTFVAYGSKTPLVLKGSFNAEIIAGNNKQESLFYVISGGTRNLLGRNTAVQLGVLRLGLHVNQIKDEDVFPKLKDVLIHIPIDESIKPVAQPYRRIPIPLEKKVQEKLEELVKRDIIEEVNISSKWVSPIVPILKENGDVRLCVDMRRANAAIQRENHPLPTMDKLLPQVRDAKYFSKLDIRDAFHQLELHPESRHITTFITNRGMFRYKRLMFGITCAPEIFQKTIERILVGCDGVINFIDDILIYGRNKEEHDTRLEKVMEVLRNSNVVLRQDKCIIGVQKVHFLGHELSETGIKPLQKYISAIQDFRPPNTVAELQSFMGLVNYVGKWIPDLATVTEPMKELLRNRPGKNSDIQKDWGLNQQTAFNKLKMALANIPTLGYYDASKKTIVIADASPVGLGAVLVQVHNNEPRIIAFGSKTLTSCERRYCQTEKEALALVWAVEHFHMFLYGKEFDLITDHKPLEQNGEVERQNRDILKRLKIAKVEKKSLQDCLSDYLMMYNSTPHSVTGKSPAELFFRRKFRDKIPMIRDVGQEIAEDLDIRDKDKEMKEKGKAYADTKRNAKECNLMPGDKVYLKNVVKDNKLSTTFAPIPFTVESANKGDIQVRNEETGQTLRRNVVHLKKIEGKWEVMRKGEENKETEKSDGSTDFINLVLHN
ncbi:uncharacterized protein [Choristoneura fumiferana]|uniref:uncharacterized protein n=1 Tax=Choristoneura fumiferana TaxID=7141 RepID=UPI003D15A06A